jgi:hypothetical protein
MRPWESVPAPAGEPAQPGGAGARADAPAKIASRWDAVAAREPKKARTRAALGFVRIRARSGSFGCPAAPARPPRGSMRDWEFYPISAAVATGCESPANPLQSRYG